MLDSNESCDLLRDIKPYKFESLRSYMLSLPHSAGESRNHIKSPALPRGKPDLPQFQRNLSETNQN